MKNLMLRCIDLANFLGLISGAIAIIYLGYEINNQTISLFGKITLFIFVGLFSLNIILLIRDFIRHRVKMIPFDF